MCLPSFAQAIKYTPSLLVSGLRVRERAGGVWVGVSISVFDVEMIAQR